MLADTGTKSGSFTLLGWILAIWSVIHIAQSNSAPLGKGDLDCGGAVLPAARLSRLAVFWTAQREEIVRSRRVDFMMRLGSSAAFTFAITSSVTWSL